MLVHRSKFSAVMAVVSISFVGCSDLVVEEVHHESFLATARLAKATVKNQGWGGASESVTTIEVTPATSSMPSRSASVDTAALAAGEEIELPMTQLVPGELPSPTTDQCMELRVCADSEGSVWEGWFWEGNNCTTRSYCGTN